MTLFFKFLLYFILFCNDFCVSEQQYGYNETHFYFPRDTAEGEIDVFKSECDTVKSRRVGSGRDVVVNLQLHPNSKTGPIDLTPLLKECSASLCSKLQDLPVKINTHGWQGHGNGDSVTNIRDAYITTGKYNVITLDWSSAAKNIYCISAGSTPDVGVLLAKFVDQLVQCCKIDGKNVHLIGFSLGAHVVGIAGYSVKQTRIGRITGLDPAAPFFEWPSQVNQDLRIDKSDADFVDIVHTCKGIVGVKQKYGHIDFFPNDGSWPQPGCISGFTNVVTAGVGCCHARAFKYFAESIQAAAKFETYPCNKDQQNRAYDCQVKVSMGAAAKVEKQDSYCSQTNSQAPFAKSLQAQGYC